MRWGSSYQHLYYSGANFCSSFNFVVVIKHPDNTQKRVYQAYKSMLQSITEGKSRQKLKAGSCITYTAENTENLMNLGFLAPIWPCLF